MAQFTVILTATIVFITLPSIKEDLELTAHSLNWVVNAYSFALGACLVIGGRTADIFGQKRIFLAGVGIFLVGSLSCGLSPTGQLLLASRAVQGLGAALIAPTALSLLTILYPEDNERRKSLAIWSAVTAGTGSIALILGGLVAEMWSWPFLFYINVPVGVVVFIVGLRLLPTSARRSEVRANVAGSVSIVASIGCLAYTLATARQDGWLTPAFFILASVTIVLWAAFIATERVQKYPLVGTTILKNGSLLIANIATIVVTGISMTVNFYLSFYLQEAKGYSVLEAGMTFSIGTLAVLAGPAVAHRLIPRIGAKRMLIASLLVIAFGMAWLSAINNDSSYIKIVLVGLVLMSFGTGCSTTTLTILATSKVARGDVGLASGMFNTSRHVGGALAFTLLSAMAASQGAMRSQKTQITISEQQFAYGGSAILAFCAAILVMITLRTVNE